MVDVVIAFIFSEILFIVFSMKGRGAFFNLFFCTSLIYDISYIYGAFFALGLSTYPGNYSITDFNFTSQAITHAIVFKIFYNIGYFFKKGRHSHTYKNAMNYYNYNKRFFSNKILFLLLLICIFTLIIGIPDVSTLFYTKYRFIGNGMLINISKFLSVLLLCMVLINHYMYRRSYFILSISIVVSIIYSMAIFSRFVVIPFSVYFLFRLFLSRSKRFIFLKSIINIFIIMVLYFDAIIFRGGQLGVISFITNIPETIVYFLSSFNMVLSTISGFATLTLTLSGLHSGAINVSPNPLLFLIYISPIPSFLISGLNFSRYQSLTPYFNFPIGINTDLVSESILWFGSLFFVFSFLLGCLVKKIDINSGGKYWNAVFFMSMVVFFALSSVASIRASSRLFMYAITFFFLYHSLRKKSHE